MSAKIEVDDRDESDYCRPWIWTCITCGREIRSMDDRRVHRRAVRHRRHCAGDDA